MRHNHKPQFAKVNTLHDKMANVDNAGLSLSTMQERGTRVLHLKTRFSAPKFSLTSQVMETSSSSLPTIKHGIELGIINQVLQLRTYQSNKQVEESCKCTKTEHSAPEKEKMRS